jgi:hypothetical protein
MNKNSTNADLYAGLGEIIKDGKTRIFAKAPSKNPEYVTIFLCQEVKKPSGSTTSAQKYFLGWDDTRLLRAIHNAKAEIADKMEIGKVVPFDILEEEKIVPAYEGQEPKVNPGTSEVVMFKDQRVYTHGSLVPIGQGGIKLLNNQEAAVIKTADEKFEAAKKAAEAELANVNGPKF